MSNSPSPMPTEIPAGHEAELATVKKVAARKNMLVIVEVDPDSRSTIEHIVTEAHVRAMWKRMESLAAQCDQFKKCLKYARTTMAVIADNAKLRGVEYRSLMSEVSRIDAALAEVKS